MGKLYTKGGVVHDRQNAIGDWVVSFNVTTETSYTQYYTEAGKLWSLMKTRCSDTSRYSIEKPTYKDCKNHFTGFQDFIKWCFEQEAYLLTDDSGRWQLDKDILFKGNKIYSPKTCAFVPPYINGLLSNCIKKTDLPLGVNFRERYNKFVAQGNLEGRRKHLGHFDCPELAHRAWQINKVQALKAAVERYSNSFGSRLEVCLALEQRISTLLEDINTGEETISV